MPDTVLITRVHKGSKSTERIIRLNSARRSDIRSFIEGHFIDWENVNIALSTATIDSHDNPDLRETYQVVFVHRGPLGVKNHTESYILTKFNNIEIQYYEYWAEREDFYSLERIYINFFYNTRELGRNSLFSVHVDPMKAGRFAVYEAMPHYHFYLAPQPISKMHIPLDSQNGIKCISDYSSLKKLLLSSVKALSYELETRHRIAGSKIDKFIHAFRSSS